MIETEVGVKVNYGQIPDEPSDLVVLNYRSGISPRYTFDRRKAFIRRPFLEVLVRNENYFKGMKIADDILHELEHITGQLDDVFIIKISPTSDILVHSRDEQNRYKFLVNFLIEYRED